MMLILISFLSISYYLAPLSLFFFFFNDTATTEIYTLSLHDALPILRRWQCHEAPFTVMRAVHGTAWEPQRVDRKSTRLNSSHSQISYAVFCLKKKKKQIQLKYSRTLLRQ